MEHLMGRKREGLLRGGAGREGLLRGGVTSHVITAANLDSTQIRWWYLLFTRSNSG